MESKKQHRHLPPKWLFANKIGSIMNDCLIACKTPLDSKYTPCRKSDYWTPADLLSCPELHGKKIIAVANLTMSSDYYNGEDEFESKGIAYKRFELMGNGCNVPEEAVRECTKWIHDHIDQQDGICVVHCTHGYNRTGLIVCAYLTEYCGMSLNDAVKLFKEKRPSGIYRPEILTQLENLCNEQLCDDNKQVSKPY